MNTKSFLSSATILGALLASTSLCAPAYAQKIPPLAPITGWAVTRIDANADSGAYCALARRFSRNTILTLARNGNNETSIALDLQVSRLSPGINIQVTMDPGAGEQRSYDIAPASDKAFVVRLGRDDRFFAALQRTGALRIDVADESYNFNLADIDEGQAKLNSCIDNQAAGNNEGQNASNIPTGGDIHQEIASLRSDVQGLRQENKRLTSIVSKSDNLQTLQEPDAHDSVIKSELSSSARRLQDENLDLKDQSSGISAGDDLAMGGPLKNLQHENSRLQNTLFSMSLKHADVDGVGDRISGSMKKGVSPPSLNSIRTASGDEDHRTNIHFLRAENERLHNIIAQKSGFQQVADNAPVAPPSATQITEEPAAPSLIPPAAPPVAVAPIPAPPAVAVTPMPPVNPAVDMQQKIESLTAQIADKDKKLLELSALTTEAETLRAKNKELETKLLKNSADKKAVDALNQKIKNLQAENSKLAGQIQQSTAGSGDADKIAALTKENAELKSQIETLTQVQKTGSLSMQDAAELIALRKENANLKQKLSDLETQLAEAQKGQSVASSDVKECAPAIKKTQDEDDAQKRRDMQAMAHENMELKQKLAQYEKTETPSAPAQEAKLESAPAKKETPVKKSKAPKHKAADDVAVKATKPAEEAPIAPPEAKPSDDVQNDISDAQNEAQRQEAQMRDALKEPRTASKPVKIDDDKPVEVHAAQDPFAPIKADNDVKSYESIAGARPKVKTLDKPVTEETTEVAPAPKPVEAENIPPLAHEKAQAPEAVAVKSDEALSEKIIWNKPGQAPVAKPVTAAAVKMPDKGVYQPEFSVKDILNKAELVSNDDVKLVPKASNANKAAWQWKSGGVYGSAEQVALPDANEFDGDVKEYLNKTQKRCAGDFAIEPDNSKQLGDLRLDSYEIACVGKGVNSSASLLFIGKDGTFTAMAHEAPADKMSDAMNIRDKIMKFIGGS